MQKTSSIIFNPRRKKEELNNVIEWGQDRNRIIAKQNVETFCTTKASRAIYVTGIVKMRNCVMQIAYNLTSPNTTNE